MEWVNKNFIVKIEKNGERSKNMEFHGKCSTIDEMYFLIEITAEIDLRNFFVEDFNSEKLIELIERRRIRFIIETSKIEFDLKLAETLNIEFGNNYICRVQMNDEWDHADGGYSDGMASIENMEEEDFHGIGGVGMAITDAEVVTYSTLEILFATDREKTDNMAPNEIFSNSRGHTFETGICKVSIPNGHKLGELEKPGWLRNLTYENPENPEKHISIISLDSLSKKEFISIIKNKIVTSNESDVFIFIHGYNVSFDEAVKRTAQIAFDLSFSGVPITYSWPSKGSVNGYLSDEDSVLWTTPNLKEFLKLILSNNDLKRCHLIAHSMGNRAVTNALRELNLEKIDLSKINQIILAAPDIDSQVFSDVIFPGIKGIGENITLYASSRDKALKMSRWLRDGILRIGESGENLVIVDGIDTIDASHIDTNFLGHGYFAETKELLYDLHMVLNLYLSPDQRKLKRISSHPKGDYWQFI